MSRFERWSRRKLASQDGDDDEGVAVGLEAETNDFDNRGENSGESRINDHDRPLGASPASDTDTLGEEPASIDPEPGSLDETLPDPDTLPPGSDIKAFLEPGVSRGLRRRALRRLFAGDNYGIRDGLDDYDHDYREKLKPLASELAQRMRQWTRPVDPPEAEEEDVVDEALNEVSQETAPVSPEDAATDQKTDQEEPKDSDENLNSTSNSTKADLKDVEDQASLTALDEGRVGVRQQIDQD